MASEMLIWRKCINAPWVRRLDERRVRMIYRSDLRESLSLSARRQDANLLCLDMSRYQYGALWMWCSSLHRGKDRKRKTARVFVSAAGRQKEAGGKDFLNSQLLPVKKSSLPSSRIHQFGPTKCRVKKIPCVMSQLPNVSDPSRQDATVCPSTGDHVLIHQSWILNHWIMIWKHRLRQMIILIPV